MFKGDMMKLLALGSFSYVIDAVKIERKKKDEFYVDDATAKSLIKKHLAKKI